MILPRAITGGAALVLGGRRWWLRITHRVLLDCEEASGVDMLAASQEIAHPSARLMRTLLWAALCAAGGSWSLREVGAHLSLQNFFEAHQALLKAWETSMPDRSREKAGEPASAKVLTWLEAWASARQDLGLSDEAWLDMTPRQVHALRAVQLQQMQREELLVGIVASTMANFGFRSPTKAISAESFMLHRLSHDEDEDRPVTGEIIMAVLAPIKAKLGKAA